MIQILKVSENISPRLKPYIPIAITLVKQFGSNLEVVIHDLTQPHQSVVAIIGNVTDRELYAPTTNYVLKLLKNPGEESNVYKTTTMDGKELKSSTTIIKDDNNFIVGCFCINFLIEGFSSTIKTLTELFLSPEEKEETTHNYEKFNNTIHDVVNSILEEVIEDRNANFDKISREQKIDIIRELNERGLFLVKGAVEIIAEKFGTSKYTIYNYLDKVKDSKLSNPLIKSR
ncbi:transcriptional regulator [Pseudalkalibacillus sp. A8]|uniref:helix-turn-helix transcriptional regulator n=1 Tax=Pseudalkalibacillus sp. A8 TaxID=3382641 RepID=UPI0038B5CA4C